MCGRYETHHTEAEILARFDTQQVIRDLLDPPVFEPRFNVAPTDRMPVVVISGGARALTGMRWGLVPFWAKDPSVGARMINARAESVAEKPAFRDAVARRRCLVPAGGFYEWRRTGAGKQPYHIGVAGGGLFAFAGLWAKWKAPDGVTLRSFTILTTEPNERLKDIHNRMPVMLPPEAEAVWLDPDTPLETATELLRPYPTELTEAYPVTPAVGRVDYNQPDCILPLRLPASGAPP
jgi:putative SOS response-associated peptidase YedK